MYHGIDSGPDDFGPHFNCGCRHSYRRISNGNDRTASQQGDQYQHEQAATGFFLVHGGFPLHDLVICEAMIAMAHKFGMKVIAEGVETPEQRDLLAAAGCVYGQG